MQVQSSTDPPKKLALGERAVMADGNDYNMIQLKERGQPVEVVYTAEGTPFVAGPTAIFKSAPHPTRPLLADPDCVRRDPGGADRASDVVVGLLQPDREGRVHAGKLCQARH